MTLRILHICTGNICRSPMTERLMLARLTERFGSGGFDVRIGSAGTYDGNAGSPMDGSAARVLRELGVAPDGFVARGLTVADVAAADLVLTATTAHRTAVLRLDPGARRRTFMLRELARLAREIRAVDLPPGTPGQQLAALTERAAGLRASWPAASAADDIHDPYGEPLDVFRRVAAEIDAALADVLAPLSRPGSRERSGGS